MDINIYKKEFKEFSQRATTCTLYARVIRFGCADLNLEVVGRSVCKKGDTFNSEVGKHLSYEKAYRKLIKKIRFYIANNRKYFEDVLKHLENDDARLKRLATKSFDNTDRVLRAVYGV